MIEVIQSPDFVYLCKLHNQYIAIEDSEEAIIFKPLAIGFNTDAGLWELTVQLLSNNKFDDNEQETYASGEFSRISSRLH